MYGVAIIGCGQISDLHAAAYSDRSDARIVALSDRDSRLAEAKRGLWGVPDATVCQDYREALQRDDVDIVEILVPHDVHYEIAVAALQAGKHVSLQKPMTLSLAEANQLVEASDSASGRFRVFENFLFYPPIQRAKEVIDSGELGDIATVAIRSIGGYNDRAWPPPAEPWRFDVQRCGGGPMVFDDGHHMFAIAMHLAGPISRVHSSIRNTEFGPGKVADVPASVTWEYANGALGSWLATVSPGLYIETNQYASNDSVEVTGANGVMWVTRGHGHLTSLPPVVVAKGRGMDYHQDLDADWAVSFRRSSHHFLTAITSGEPAVLSARKAREVLRVALAAGQSAERGSPVQLEPADQARYPRYPRSLREE
jgi:predicted dehydrogenase